MKYSLTIFKNIRDVRTSRRLDFDTWEEFENLMKKLSNSPGLKPKKDDPFNPKGSPLISPAIFEKNTTRKNKNVLYWAGWAALDIDDYDGEFEEAIKQFEEYKCICYSSASSTKEKPKFRIILPLTRNVKKEEIKHFWFALNKEFNSLVDPQTKDLSRMYYIPAKYPNAFNFILFNRKGKILDVDILKSKYEYNESTAGSSFLSSLPEEVQQQLVEYRKTKLTKTSYSWSGLSDCPFINKKLIAEYRSITESGWYHKMYQIMMSIASNAVKRGYPITSKEIAILCKELDSQTGNWYENRNFEDEAERAIMFACRNI